MTESPVDVAAIRAALVEATCGPWQHDARRDHVTAQDATVDVAEVRSIVEDAKLIVLLRNGVESLLERVEFAESEAAQSNERMNEIWNLSERLSIAETMLDRAQAASEGVDLLIAQAERRGAVKALRRFRDRFDSFDDPHDNAIVAAIADEDADAIERGSL